MNAAVFLEHRFERTPDGAVWTDGPFAYRFFTRYLDIFDAVRAVARVRCRADGPQASWVRADGPGVSFAAIPYYVGPWQYLRTLPRVWLAASRAARASGQAVILRAPSEIGALAARDLAARGAPFSAEIVGDPWDAFAPGSMSHPLRGLARRRHTAALRRICRLAGATAYVTAQALQQRYPPAPGAFTTHYSSVELPEEAFRAAPAAPRSGPLRIISVGSMEHLYKAQDVLLEALAGVPNVHLTLVGDGRYRSALESQTKRLGLPGNVRFSGALPAGAAVREELDRADLFVLPSRQEGLPRAMIEAMARGLPCLGSSAGGIGELIPQDCLAPPGDARALRAKILEMAADPARLAHEAACNLARAREYHEETLRRRRRAFYAETARLARRASALPLEIKTGAVTG